MSHCEETEEEVVDPPETSLCEQHGCQTEAQSSLQQQKPDCPELSISVENYSSTFGHGLSFKVPSPVTSDSDESNISNVSFKSDQSKDVIITSFEVPLKRKASTGSNCLSDRSQDHIDAKRRRSRAEFSSSSEDDFTADNSDDQLQSQKERSGQWDIDFRTRTSDSDESNISNVSFKSDRSRDNIISFKQGQPSVKMKEDFRRRHREM